MRGLTPARLRLSLVLLFVALAVPSAWLIVQTQRQLKWEALHQQRELAAELAERIDAELQRRIAIEEAREHDDYEFVAAADARARRSPLSQLPAEHDWPGLLGWFQIDPAGHFSSPVLPRVHERQHAFDDTELQRRRRVHDQLLDVLARNRLTERRRGERDVIAADARVADEVYPPERIAKVSAPASVQAPPAAQQAFDQLNLGRERRTPVTLGQSIAEPAEEAASARRRPSTPAAALETDVLADVSPVSAERAQTSAEPEAPLAVRMFDQPRDPFELARLDSGHFVLFRRIWRNGERSIQGALFEPAPFVAAHVGRPFAGSVLAGATDLAVLWQGTPIEHVAGRRGRDYGTRPLQALPLHRARLSAPLADLELQWTLTRLPVTPGAVQLAWSGAVLFAVLGLGLWLLYRVGLHQLQLVRQQQDFVAAVSHELKTPLTSIRMYGELLRAGWVDEARRQTYYAYIHDESARLSRLIGNVLQLARLERDERVLELRAQPLATLLDLVRSKVQALVDGAGFECVVDAPDTIGTLQVQADADAFVQIIINLVDNAVKFSARAERRRIEISTQVHSDRVLVCVRDHGPGVPATMRRRIFELFVRGGSELTREAHGTGIGLALVRQLARGMGGDVDVIAADPGAEFRLLLARAPSSPAA